MEFNRGKYKVHLLGKHNAMPQFKLGDGQLGSSFRKGPGGPGHGCAFMAKVNSIMGKIRQSIASGLGEVILPLCSALVRHLECGVQLCAPQHKRDILE